jgi:uncharacterized protein YidB (DUF937 family)
MSEFLGQMMGPLIQALGFAQGAAGGAFPALLAQLENAGLGEHVGSWIGHGENLPVSPQELEGVFTPEQLNILAEHTGATPAEVLEILSRELPEAVAQATPKPE